MTNRIRALTVRSPDDGATFSTAIDEVDKVFLIARCRARSAFAT